MEGRGAVIYCDSSFLVPLYLYEAGRSDEARRVASGWTEPAVISPFGELEWINTLSRKVMEKEITAAESGQLVREFKQDLNSGIFCWPSSNLAVMFRDAVQLSLRQVLGGI
jgi:predicted nucleic acid-binding protein